jgi:hypothetical protein
MGRFSSQINQSYMDCKNSLVVVMSYGLDCFGPIPGIAEPKLALGPIQSLMTMVLEGAIFLGQIRPERESDHSPHLVPKSGTIIPEPHSPICLRGIMLKKLYTR